MNCILESEEKHSFQRLLVFCGDRLQWADAGAALCLHWNVTAFQLSPVCVTHCLLSSNLPLIMRLLGPLENSNCMLIHSSLPYYPFILLQCPLYSNSSHSKDYLLLRSMMVLSFKSLPRNIFKSSRRVDYLPYLSLSTESHWLFYYPKI